MRQAIERISVDEFIERLKAQGVPREHAAVVCPVCNTVQSMASLIKAGVPAAHVECFIAYSCEGRFTGQGSALMPERHPRDTSKRGCNWTLGGLFQLHTLEVVHDGKVHPRFEVATKEQAQALMVEMGGER